LNFSQKPKEKNFTANRNEPEPRTNGMMSNIKFAAFARFAVYFFLLSNVQIFAQENHLASFSDPARLWGNGIERVIEEAYRQYFKTRIIGDRVMNVRIPFAMNNERDLLLESGWRIHGDGKGNPDMLWPIIDRILDSADFAEYINALSSGNEKVIIFDIKDRKWTVTAERFIIARIKAGSYTGLPHRPFVLTSGKGALESDVFNYLFCVGHVGIDCSGFVWQILAYIGRRGGIDLGKTLSQALGAPPGADPARYAGTSFYNSRNPQVISINDEIRNLRPADVLLFRDFDGTIVHSAIIQSIDWEGGVIRYLQCNSVAPPQERGVHEAFIHFNPANTAVSLKDPSLHWTKKRFGAFPGEEVPFIDDGERYRYRLNGGGRVIRIRALIPVTESLNINTR